MSILGAYGRLLRLYPADYRASFGAEMMETFARMNEEHRRRGRTAYVGFAMAEFGSLVIGSLAEWSAKATSDSSVRGRSLEHARDTVPARATGAACAGSYNGLPQEVAEAQGRVQILVERMVQAIATHNFEGARTYSRQELTARENLQRLRVKYNIAE